MKNGLENTFLLYHDKDGKTDISVRFADEDVWVTQVQLAELYETSQQNISLHIDNIYKDEELPKEATHKDFLLVQQDHRHRLSCPIPYCHKVQAVGHGKVARIHPEGILP